MDKDTRYLMVCLNTVGEALRPSMPMVADLLDEASDTIEGLRDMLERKQVYEENG